MTTGPSSPKFSQLVLAEFGTFPRKGMIYIGVVCAAAQAWGLFLWNRQDVPAAAYVMLAAIVLAWLGVFYVTALAILQVRPSASGLAKFLVTSLLTALPVLLAAVFLIVGVRTSATAFYVLGGLLLLGGLVLLPLLTGWSITQAISTKIIGPMAALGATKGHRGGLIFTALVVAGLNRVVPSLGSTTDFAVACLFAVIGLIAGIASAMAIISIAVVASRMMSANLMRN